MRLSILRKRFTPHCIAYSLLMTSAASCALVAPLCMAADATQRYSIAAGSLDNALSQFAAAANVILSFAPAQTTTLRTSGLNGNYSVEQGFAILLQDCGLMAVPEGPGSYILQPQPEAGTLMLGAKILVITWSAPATGAALVLTLITRLALLWSPSLSLATNLMVST